MRLALAALALASWLAAPGPVRAQDDSFQWLQRAATAARSLNYTGTFVYQRGTRSETSRITHAVDDDGEHEKLELLDGPSREIIRSNDRVSCYFSESKTVRVEKRRKRRSFPALLPEEPTRLADSYHVRTGPRERIAGFDCQKIVLEPRDQMRYGHRLWADARTGLLLKAQTVNERGEVVEQFAFTQLAIGTPIAPEALKPREAGAEWRVEESSPGEEGASSGWTVSNPPSGFRKIMDTKRRLSSRPGMVSHLVYSDGISAVSVFVEAINPDRKLVPGVTQQGAIHVYTRTQGASVVTVLGEAPAVTVLRIGNSLVAEPQ